MAVRAKFRCHAIKLQASARPKEGITYDSDKRKYFDSGGNEVPYNQTYEPWEQPTVYLSAVYGKQEVDGENAEFFAATPSATCELTISNPDAAQFFELDQEYYVDFSRAPSKS